MDRSSIPRRRLLTAVASVPVLGAVAATVARLGAHAALIRPAARGDSAHRCAQCGDRDHTMLSGTCPAAPTVL